VLAAGHQRDAPPLFAASDRYARFMPERVWAFVGVAALFAVSPGPDALLVINRSISHGRRVSLFTAAGCATGLTVWAALSAVGLAALFNASAIAFEIVKFLGVGYLVLLGVQAIARSRHSERSPGVPVAAPHPRRPFIQGLLTNLLNPKAGAFFVAVLPQFVAPHESVLPTTLIFGIVDSLVSLVALSTYSALALAVGTALRRPRPRRILDRLTGVVLIALGVRLAFESR
jgi:threonine/homoserine/homoserine lactone efflux protein